MIPEQSCKLSATGFIFSVISMGAGTIINPVLQVREDLPVRTPLELLSRVAR